MVIFYTTVININYPGDFCVSPRPFGLDLGTLDLGLTIKLVEALHWCDG